MGFSPPIKSPSVANRGVPETRRRPAPDAGLSPKGSVTWPSGQHREVVLVGVDQVPQPVPNRAVCAGIVASRCWSSSARQCSISRNVAQVLCRHSSTSAPFMASVILPVKAAPPRPHVDCGRLRPRSWHAKYDCPRSGCGLAARHVLWEHEIVGSNPTAPTTSPPFFFLPSRRFIALRRLAGNVRPAASGRADP
jgi:hypothetical protein